MTLYQISDILGKYIKQLRKEKVDTAEIWRNIEIANDYLLFKSDIATTEEIKDFIDSMKFSSDTLYKNNILIESILLDFWKRYEEDFNEEF